MIESLVENQIVDELTTPYESHIQSCLLTTLLGLQILLISNPNTRNPSAALLVKSGSINDPDNFLGLSHFLEHMVFIKSKKYPKVDTLFEKVGELGGFSNAFTADDRTVFYFESAEEPFPEALDIFAQCFQPDITFDASYESREIHAIDSENQNQQSNFYFPFWAVLNSAKKKEDPSSRFTCGSIESLQKEGILEELQKLHRERYTPENFRLVVQSGASLGELKRLVEKTFGFLYSTNAGRTKREYAKTTPENEDMTRNEHFDYNEPIFSNDSDHSLPSISKEDSLFHATIYSRGRPLNNMIVVFHLPPQLEYYQSGSHEAIASWLSYKGKGSLYRLLREEMFVTDMDVAVFDRNSLVSLLVVELSLTEKGLDNIETIYQLGHAWVNILCGLPEKASSGPSLEGYLENLQLKKLFRNKLTVLSGDSSETLEYANNMMDYKKQDFLVGSALMKEVDVEKFKRLLGFLGKPNRSHCFINADIDSFLQRQGYSDKEVALVKTHSDRHNKIPMAPVTFKYRLDDNRALVHRLKFPAANTYSSLLRKDAASASKSKNMIGFIVFYNEYFNSSPENYLASNIFSRVLSKHVGEHFSDELELGMGIYMGVFAKGYVLETSFPDAMFKKGVDRLSEFLLQKRQQFSAFLPSTIQEAVPVPRDEEDSDAFREAIKERLLLDVQSVVKDMKTEFEMHLLSQPYSRAFSLIRSSLVSNEYSVQTLLEVLGSYDTDFWARRSALMGRRLLRKSYYSLPTLNIEKKNVAYFSKRLTDALGVRTDTLTAEERKRGSTCLQVLQNTPRMKWPVSSRQRLLLLSQEEEPRNNLVVIVQRVEFDLSKNQKFADLFEDLEKKASIYVHSVLGSGDSGNSENAQAEAHDLSTPVAGLFEGIYKTASMGVDTKSKDSTDEGQGNKAALSMLKTLSNLTSSFGYRKNFESMVNIHYDIIQDTIDKIVDQYKKTIYQVVKYVLGFFFNSAFSSKFFTEMRTNRQFGYITLMKYVSLLSEGLVYYLIQSPDKDVSEIRAGIRDFRENYMPVYLEDFDEKRLQAVLGSLFSESNRDSHSNSLKKFRSFLREGKDFLLFSKKENSDGDSEEREEQGSPELVIRYLFDLETTKWLLAEVISFKGDVGSEFEVDIAKSSKTFRESE